MADTSLIRTTASFNHTTTRPGIAQESVKGNEVESHFLRLANLVLGCEDLTFHRELQPISGLDIIGDGLSFIVKRGSVIAPADPPSVAWKISKARLLPSAKMYDDPRTEAHRLRAVLAECRVLCHPPIRNHPNIATLQQVAWAPDSRDMMSITACLGMEYAEYGTLADLQSYGSIHPLEYSTKKRLCLDIAEGLRALHKCGIVHGDVKSENVLIFKHAQHKYQAKLSDFGCSIITGDYANSTADIEVRLAGFTRGYQAPESAKSMPVSQLHLTDTYSLGMLMWRIFVDGQDPLSTYFDLPAESLERQKKISEIQGIGISIAGVVVATIEQAVDSLEGEEHVLLQIFIHTIATIPAQRNLEEVISILQSSLNVEDYQPASPMAPLKVLTEKDLPIPRSVEFLAILGKPLQAAFFHACEDVVSQCRTRLTLKQEDELGFLLFKFLYVMLKCRIAGIGCKRDPDEAFQTLFEMSQLRSFSAEKASGILLNLRDALGAKFKEDLAGQIFNNTLHAAGNEAIPASAWIQQHTPDALQHPSYVNLHAAYLSNCHSMASEARSMGSEDHAVSIIETYLKNNEINSPVFDNGNTLLHAASLFGSISTLQLLIEKHHADINVRNVEGETPLLLTFMHGRSDLIIYLLNKHANISVPNDYDSILDWFALVDPSYLQGTLDLLLERDIKMPEVWCKDPFNSLAGDFTFHHTIHGDGIIRAIGTNRLDVVEAIITLCRKDPHYMLKDLRKSFRGAVVVAAILHSWEILAFLLSTISEMCPEIQKRQFGSNWRVDDSSSLMRHVLSAFYTLDRITIHGSNFRHAGKQTLGILDEFGFIEPQLYFHDEHKSTIVSALETGDEFLALQILETKACQDSVNTPDPHTGLTPLHASIRTGSKLVFSRLIELGARVNFLGNYPPGSCLATTKMSYLHVCASHGADVFFAEEILKAGVPVDIPDHNNNPPLHLAILRRSYSLATLLLQRGESLNRVADRNWTLMGTLLPGAYRRHYHDFLGAIRFLFEIDDKTLRPDFIVYPAGGLTILHVAVETEPNVKEHHTGPMEPQVKRPTFDALTSLVLEFYSSPDQINAKTLNGLTALHIAIMNRNVSGVQQLLERGADPMIPPPESIALSTLDLTRKHVLLYGNQVLLRGQIPRSFREYGRKSTTISSLIYNSRQWPNASFLWPRISKLYEAVEPFLGQMRMIAHEDSKRILMQTTVHNIINNATDNAEHAGLQLDQDENQFKAILEYQEHINSLLQPWFMAEARIGMAASSAESEGPRGDFLMGNNISRARADVPWLAFFGNLGVQEIQQAALFDIALREIGNGEQSEVKILVWREGLEKYFKSMKPEDLPISPLLVKYPFSLRHIYESCLKLEGFPLSGVRHVLSCLRFMGAPAHKFSCDDPPPMSAEAFRNFHLQTLQGNPKKVESLRPTIGVGVKCACHNDAIPKIPLETLEKLFPPEVSRTDIVEEDCNQARIDGRNLSSKSSTSAFIDQDAPLEDGDHEDIPETVRSSVHLDAETANKSSETEHLGFFCAGRACASKVLTNTFIKGLRLRCGPCVIANFCEDCENSHSHPELYVHSMFPYGESQLSWSEYEEMQKDGKSIRQTVWEMATLTEDGRIEFESEGGLQMPAHDKSEYDMDGLAEMLERKMKVTEPQGTASDAEPYLKGQSLGRRQNEEEAEGKEQRELLRAMVRWTAG